MAETTKKILERMLADIPDRYDTSPGTYTYDLEKSAAMEFENAHDRIDTLDGYFFVETATGAFLDKRVGEFGLTRKEASEATGYVTITGDVGATVETGAKVAAGSIVFSVTLGAEIPGEGSVTVPVKCDNTGSQGNVIAGAISRIPVTLPGLLSVINSEATTGGSDAETDAELRARFKEYVAHPETSGNKWQYIAWAKAVDGVGDAKCIPLWNGNGTVKVVIVDTERNQAPPELISAVQSTIDEKKPIGAAVTVATADTITINVACNLMASGDVTDALQDNIRDYLQQVSFANGYVSIAKIGRVILNTEGVNDYTNLTINSGTDNIPVTDTQIAVLGGVTID